MVLVAAKIGVAVSAQAAEVAATIDRAEQAVRAAEPMVTSLSLEPDIFDSDCLPAAPSIGSPPHRGDGALP